MNKVLIKLYVPSLESSYELLIPNDQVLVEILPQIQRSIIELSDSYFKPNNQMILINSETGEICNLGKSLLSLHIENGTILTLV